MQESKLIKLTDSVQLVPVESAEKLQKDFMQMPMVSGKRSLYVRLAATHAGLITRNNAYYLPDKMRAGAATFLQNYPKPVLVAHNEEADPVGRVARAKYIDVPVEQLKPFLNYSEAKDMYLIGKAPVEPRFLDAFNNGKLSYLRSVDFVVDSLFKSGVLDNPEFPGLGYIELVLNITDSEAQEKFLDGRYLTASTSMTTNKAICTICKQDWASDGMCDHKRGKKYDGVKCVLVTGDMTYDEVSVVSRPADRHSKVLQIGQELIDNVEDSTDMEDNTGEVFKGLPWSILDSLEEENNTVADEAINTTNSEPDKPVNEEEVLQKRAEADKAAVSDFFAKYTNNEYPDDANVNKALTDLVSSIEFSVVPEFVSVVQDQLKSKELDSADKLWDSLVNEEWGSYDESEDEALGAEDLKDAKLSSGQRKKLASSTFCGPNRSFPVPDCSHVTAARRLIGRAKVSAAAKSRILGCVARKARALGCDTVQDNTSQEMERLETVCEACKDAAAKLVALEASVGDLTNKLKDAETKSCEKCVVLESKVSDSSKDLEAARAELQIVLKDVQELQGQLVDSVEVARKLKAERLADLALLKGRELNDKQPINKEFRDSLVNQFLTGDLDLDVQLKDATEAVDIIKIADSINSGLARNPSRTLEDPVPRQSNQGNSREESKMPDADSLRNITETYLAGKFGGNIPGFGRGTVAAERYLDSLKQKGLLPAEFNVGSEAT